MAARTQLHQSSTPLGTLSPGTVLAGRYQIEKIIGTGGMGAVYAARDRRFRNAVRRCAVKEMYDSIADTTAREKARESFEREANILAGLNHASIPKVFDYFTEGERHYLVYEFVEGQDMARALYQRGRPFPAERVVSWAIQLTRVLEMLHQGEPPIIFRDLKPSNVILSPNRSEVMLIDFGIAKHFQQVEKGTMIGTEGYAPPEQYEGVASPLVDVYGLGATMHQLLTNTDPQEFRPFSYAQRPIKKYNPSVPDELAQIVMRALSYEAADRWPTMGALRTGLERVARRLAGGRSGAGGTKVSGLFARHMRTREIEPERPGTPADVRTGNAGGVTPEAGVTRAVGGDVDHGAGANTREVGSTVPVQGQEVPPQGATSGALRKALETDETTMVPRWTFASEEEIRSTPAIDRDCIYIGSYDTNLYCLDRESGDFRWKYATQGGVPGTPTIWKSLVVVGSEDHHLYGLNRQDGKEVWKYPTQGRVRSSPVVDSGLVFIGSDDGYIYALDVERGHLTWKFSAGAPVRSTPCVTEEIVFVGAEDGSMTALEMHTGEQIWRIHTGGPVISSPRIAGQRLVFGSMDRQVYGVDPRSGWIVWRMKLADRVYSSAWVEDDRLYIASVDGTVYCLEPDWGKEHWRTTLGTQMTSSPVVDEEGNLLIGGVDGVLYCMDAAKGRVNWRFTTGGPIPGSPRIADGIVYFGSMDYRLYALPTVPSPSRFG